MPKARKWADVIHAWADGARIHQRIWKPVGKGGDWGPWTLMGSDTAPVRTDLFIEYRVEPDGFIHSNQKEKEAYLSGRPVQFRAKDADEPWQSVDGWLVEWCRTKDGDHQFRPLWDREWLEFRLKPN